MLLPWANKKARGLFKEGTEVRFVWVVAATMDITALHRFKTGVEPEKNCHGSLIDRLGERV